MNMNKFRLINTGRGTFIELDGKTMAKGITSVKFEQVAHENINLVLNIDLKEFEFLPDGTFDEIESQVKSTEATQDE